MAAIIFGLGRIAIINSDRRDGEKKRADALQQSINSLRSNQQEERKFFELIRELMLAQGQEQKRELLDQLRGFRFTEPTTTTTTTTVPKKAKTQSTTTTTTSNSSPTTAPRPPPSTTTTTAPPSPPPSRTCVTTPVVNVCSPTATSNERKPS